LPSFAALRQHNAHNFAVKPFFKMMANRSRKVLQIAPRAAACSLVRPALAVAPYFIFTATGAGYLVECFESPKLQQTLRTLTGFCRVGQSWRDIGEVDPNHVRDPDFGKRTLTTFRRVFAGDVIGKPLFSFFASICAALSANLASAVLDEPPCIFNDFSACISAGWSEPKTGTFAGTRHFSIISWIAAKVVKSLPAIRMIASRPRDASRRSPETVMPPCGKAIATASASRNGASGAISVAPWTARRTSDGEKRAGRRGMPNIENFLEKLQLPGK
jgi:hypothetical protein